MTEYVWKLKVDRKGYNPDQPRVPAGSAGGGRWTSGGGGRIPYHPPADIRAEAEDVGVGSIDNFARDEGISYEEAAQRIFERLNADLENPVVMRRSLESSKQILFYGRFKSQFETGRSGGVFDPEYRKKAERNGLGVPEDIPDEQRPLYGAVRVPGTEIGSYGAVEWVFKESVKDRTTITLSDSLGNFAYGRTVGDPYFRPSTASLDDAAEYYGRLGIDGIGYIETQIHGGLTLADVSRVELYRGRYTSPDYFSVITGMLNERGIEVVEHEWSP